MTATRKGRAAVPTVVLVDTAVFLFFCIGCSVDALLNLHKGSYGAIDGFQGVRTRVVLVRGLLGLVVL
jgi:hypothetical protein